LNYGSIAGHVGRIWQRMPPFFGATAVLWSRFRLRFRGHTDMTLGRTPLAKGSAHHRDHNIQKRETSMPAMGFEPAIPASEQPQTYALDHMAL
jgi:hypothetical protein